VRSLLIDAPGGRHVPLSQLADVSIKRRPADILHEDVSRYVDVTAPVSGRDEGSVRADVRRQIADVGFPRDYHATVLSPSGGGSGHVQFVVLCFGVALLAFLLLQAAFSSWRLAAAVFGGLPLALAGGVIVAFVASWDASIGALGGLVAVLAFAVRQAILMVASLRRADDDEFLTGNAAATRQGVVQNGARERLGPTLFGALAVALTVLPFLVLGDVAGNELSFRLAGTVLGGLVTATLIVLLLVPGAYSQLAPRLLPELGDDDRSDPPAGAEEIPGVRY
jgi:Cu/Ag efflux pump CusA